jgi:hypothetical protein
LSVVIVVIVTLFITGDKSGIRAVTRLKEMTVVIILFPAVKTASKPRIAVLCGLNTGKVRVYASGEVSDSFI